MSREEVVWVSCTVCQSSAISAVYLPAFCSVLRELLQVQFRHVLHPYFPYLFTKKQMRLRCSESMPVSKSFE